MDTIEPMLSTLDNRRICRLLAITSYEEVGNWLAAIDTSDLPAEPCHIRTTNSGRPRCALTRRGWSSRFARVISSSERSTTTSS